MHIPPHFQETRLEVLEKIMHDHPLGTLVYQIEGGLDATHIPFVFQDAGAGQKFLAAHIAKSNYLWKKVPAGAEVLVVFTGVNSYVSPNWYPSKFEAHRQVPTWNYQVVHVRGKISFFEEIDKIRQFVSVLTKQNEERIQESKPWTLEEGEEAYIGRMLSSIIGVQIEIQEMYGASKLNQNRKACDREGAEQRFRERGEIAMAEAIKEANG